MTKKSVIEQVEGVYRVLRLSRLRQTPGVSFDVLPPRLVPQVDAVDRVIHEAGALSPGPVGEIERPWYMHPDQADHLMVLDGKRYVDLYSPLVGRMISFEVEPDRVVRMRGAPSASSGAWENINSDAFSGSDMIWEEACLLVWPRRVFHRIRSDEATGSKSVNLATHYPGFDIETNFSIYNLDTETGEHRVIREGAADQMALPE